MPTDREPQLIEEFTALIDQHRKGLESLKSGRRLTDVKADLIAFEKRASDRFVRRVALEWEHLLPDSPPQPPSAQLLREAARIESDGLESMRTQTVAQSLETADETATALTELFVNRGAEPYRTMFTVDIARTASDLRRELDYSPQRANEPYAPRSRNTSPSRSSDRTIG